MRKNGIVRRFAALLMVLVLTVSLGFASADAADVVTAKHFNIMLVLDGSGSLTMSGGTDRHGYRFAAADMFLGLLTNQGNNVGAIVFDDQIRLDTGIQPISGNGAKKLLSEKIKGVHAGGDTNIGLALQTAVEELAAKGRENGLPCVVILMTDGITDLDNNMKEESPEEAASRAMEENAIRMAREAGIQVCAVLLNGNNAESTGEVEHIAEGTGGQYREVVDAEDLQAVFQDFYSLIYSAIQYKDKLYFGADGHAHVEITIPSFGVSEFNIILDKGGELKSLTLTDPAGVQMSDEEIEAALFTSEKFSLLKIVDPAAGVWILDAEGVPNSMVDYNLIFNTNLSAELKIDEPSDSYYGNDNVSFSLRILENGRVLTLPEAYSTTSARILLNDSERPTALGQDSAMQANADSFSVEMKLPDVDKASVFLATAEVSVPIGDGEIVITSNDVSLDVNVDNGDNLAPIAVRNPISIEIDAAETGLLRYDLSECFSDPDGDPLSFSVASSDYAADVLFVDGRELVCNAGQILSGQAEIRATDDHGASCRAAVLIRANDPPLALEDPFYHTVVIKIFGNKDDVIDLTKVFRDEQDAALSYTITDALTRDGEEYPAGTFVLDNQAQTLTVSPSGFKPGDIILHASDSKGAETAVTIHFKVVNEKLLAGVSGLTIALIAAAVLGISAFLASRRRFKGVVVLEPLGGAAGYEDDFFSERPASILGGDGNKSHRFGPFRGSVRLSSTGAPTGGLDGRAKFVVQGAQRLRFVSKKPFYRERRDPPSPLTSLNMSLGGVYSLYSDPECSQGVTVRLERQDARPRNQGGW